MTTWLDSPSIFESTELESTLLAHEFIIQSLESSRSQFLRILPNLSNVYLLHFHLLWGYFVYPYIPRKNWETEILLISINFC